MALPAGPPNRLLNTYRILAEPLRHMPRWIQRYGDPFLLKTVNGDVVMTAKPELVKQIFAGNPLKFEPFGVKAIAPLVGAGSVFTLTGQRHLRERKLLMPPFHGRRMRDYGDHMAEVTRSATRSLDGDRLCIQDLGQRISLEVIVRTVFGVTEAERVGQYCRAVGEVVSRVHPAFLFMPFLQREFAGLGPFAKFQRTDRHFDGLLDDQIARTRQRGEGADILSLLLSARYEDDSPMSDEDIKSELRTLLVAGHETTAIAIAWAIDLLHRAPHKLSKVLEELSSFGSEPTPAELESAPYLEAVCKEALRLFPVVTEVMRTLNDDFELGGRTIPAGASLSASMLMLHRRPDLYDDPDRFEPERFIDARLAPHEFAPFGGGHRRCIGAAFALFEMKVVLGTLLSTHSFFLDSTAANSPVRRNVTIAPKDGVPVLVKRRRP